MTDSADTTNPTVTALVREWKISRAQCELDCLRHEGDNVDDIVQAADEYQAEIERQLLKAVPTDVDELAGMISIAMAIIEEKSYGVEAERELEILSAARFGAFRLFRAQQQIAA